MRLRTFAGLFCTIAALAITTQASADNGTIQIKAVNDPLGAQGSAVNNINSLGIVVGSYTDANGVYHGFVSTPPHSKGTFTTIDGPGSPPLTEVWGINLEGVVTGHYQDASGINHGFVSYPPYAIVTTIDAPGATGTSAWSINLEGTIAGTYHDANFVFHGFVSYPPYTNVTTIDAPGACSSDSNPACPGAGTFIFQNSLNLLGAITGYYYDASAVSHGFVSHPPYTKFKTIDPPGACSSDSNPACTNEGTFPGSINLEGAITGFYSADASGVSHGFVSFPPYTSFKKIDAPGACSSDSNPACANGGTEPQSIDQDGVIVGFFEDSYVVIHGFVSYPPYTTFATTTFDAPGACSSDSNPACPGGGTQPLANDAVAGIVGAYFDSAGAIHGFVGHPH